jgi:hypothetical protein
VTGIFLLLGLLAEFVRSAGSTGGQFFEGWARSPWVHSARRVRVLPVVDEREPHGLRGAQQRGWHREFVSPLSAFLSTWRVFWNGQLGGTPVTAGPRLVWFGELAAVAVGVGIHRAGGEAS